jgi:hypothetical protein
MYCIIHEKEQAMDTLSDADMNYIKGFEDGCEYLMAEIERYMRLNGLHYGDLLAHLRCEEKK